MATPFKRMDKLTEKFWIISPVQKPSVAIPEPPALGWLLLENLLKNQLRACLTKHCFSIAFQPANATVAKVFKKPF